MENIRIGASAVHIPRSPDEVCRVVSGRVLVYIVPWDGHAAGRRCLLAEAAPGDLLPSLVWRGYDGSDWRLCFASLEGAQLLPLPGADPAPAREHLLLLSGLQDAPGSFAQRLVDQRELLLLKEDSALIALKEEQLSVRKRTDALVQGALRGETPSPDHVQNSQEPLPSFAHSESAAPSSAPEDAPENASGAYLSLLVLCRVARLRPVSWEKARLALGESASAPDLARLSGIPCREIVLQPGWRHADHGLLLVQIGEEWGVCTPGLRCTLHLPGKKPRRITAALERSVSSAAYSVQRPLPEGPVGRKELLRFCAACIPAAELALFAAGECLSALSALSLPALAYLLFDALLPFAQPGLLFPACLFALAVLLCGGLFGLVSDRVALRIAQKIRHGVLCAAYHRAFSLSGPALRSFDSTDLSLRILETAGAASSCARSLLMFVGAFVSLACALFLLLRLSPETAPLAAAALAAYCLFQFFCARFSAKQHADAADEDAHASSRLYQFLEAAEKLRMAGAEDRAAYEYLKPYARMRAALAKARSASSLGASVSLLAFLLLCAACFAPGLSPARTVSALLCVLLAFSAAAQLVRAAQLWHSSRADRLRALEFLRLIPEPALAKRAPGPLSGEIDIRSLRFSYDDTREILSGIDLHISPGESVGIVGASGSGKSTLLKLLLGFEQPSSGQILYDGQLLSDLDPSLLRSRFGVVMQDRSLIAGTILENITLTRPGATAEEALEAAKLAGVYDDIMAMPMQLHTIVRENASTLSGGQAQRILIARALLGKPDILFFDEATGSLDNIGQKQVCDAIGHFPCTRIVIAHRLSTVRSCDRIVVLSEGRIAEQGTCEELLAKGGLFSVLAQGQDLS